MPAGIGRKHPAYLAGTLCPKAWGKQAVMLLCGLLHLCQYATRLNRYRKIICINFTNTIKTGQIQYHLLPGLIWDPATNQASHTALRYQLDLVLHTEANHL